MAEADQTGEGLPQTFELGEFEIRPEEGKVVRGHEVEHLEPKVMAVLVYLARNRGRVVPKEELLGAVWQDTAVEEIALARSVSELRRVLGDDARHPRFIETHRRRGYQLLPPREGSRGARLSGRRGSTLVRSVGSLALVALTAAIGWTLLRQRPAGGEVGRLGAGSERSRIAVLPFVNLGPPEQEYFSAGMTEEITSRLASVRGLAVISRTSSGQYADTTKSVPQIAAELGIDYVLEGSVRWEGGPDGGSRVRITPQLIRAVDDTHVWSRVYDREVSEVFDLQSNLATEVIEQVGGVLLDSEREGLAARPTGNLEAYQAYLRGLQVARDPARIQRKDNLRAVALFERAVALDPDFALAYAELSLGHSLLYHFGHDPASERLEQARLAAERALELQPGLARAHLALGKYYYRGLRDYDRALEEYAIAERGLPNDSELQASIAYIRRRQGDMDRALAGLERARELDPRNALIHREIGLTLAMKRQYPSAEQILEQAISLAPDVADLYFVKAWTVLLGRGDWAAARSVLRRFPGPPLDAHWIQLAILAGDPDEALARLASQPDEPWIDQVSVRPRSLLEAFAHEAAGETRQARASYEAARRTLEEDLELRPDDFRVHLALGLAHAGLAHKAEAIRHGKRGVALLPVSKDANAGPFLLVDLARIHAAVGEPDAALDLLERVLSIPAGHCLSVPLLEIDPRFGPLRGLPRYRSLVEPAR